MEISDTRVAELEILAGELVCRVRDEQPEVTGHWLAKVLPDPADWWRLTFILAAAVPDDRPWSELVGWIAEAQQEPVLAPSFVVDPVTNRVVKGCGTVAAARRHKERGEPLDRACRAAARAHNTEMKRRQRARARLTSAA